MSEQTKQPPTSQPDATQLAREAALRTQEAQFAEQAKTMKAREEQLAQREKALKDKEGEDRKRRSASFAEQHTKEGRLLPRETAAVAAILNFLEAGNETISFSEGEGASARTVSRSAADMFREFVQKLDKRVNFSEVAGGAVKTPATDPKAIADQALAYCEAQRKIGNVVSIADAVTLLSQGGAQ